MSKIILGPVIGKVTHKSIRVLIEVDNDVNNVQCIATDDNGNQTTSNTSQLSANKPFAFEIGGLKEKTRYTISFNGVNDQNRKGLVTTFPQKPTTIRIGTISCNDMSHLFDYEIKVKYPEIIRTFLKGNQKGFDLWSNLENRIKDFDLIIHMGDQIYADDVFYMAKDILDAGSKKNKDFKHEILELFRGYYRENWNHTHTRNALSQCSNLMIWDDHEIRDDWGNRSYDKIKGSLDHQAGLLARQVFHEYQRQLWDNIDAIPQDDIEFHFHSWGEIGIVFLDLRGGKSFASSKKWDQNYPFLHTKQWKQLESLLVGPPESQMTDFYNMVKTLIVVSPVPLVFFGYEIGNNDIVSWVENDIIDYWCHGVNANEQYKMLSMLKQWKSKSDNHEVIVVSGDLHICGSTKIYKNKEFLFHQIITSGITRESPSALQFEVIQNLLTPDIQTKKNQYHFTHTKLVNRRNYGIISIDTNHQKRFQCQAVIENENQDYFAIVDLI